MTGNGFELINEMININHHTEPLKIYAMKKPKIKEVKPAKVVFIRTVGAYGNQEMDDSWVKLFAFVKKNKLFNVELKPIDLIAKIMGNDSQEFESLHKPKPISISDE